MKKTLATLLACVLALSLAAGCAEQPAEKTAAAEKPQTEQSEKRREVPSESIVGADEARNAGEKKDAPEQDSKKPEGKKAPKNQDAAPGKNAVTLSAEKPQKGEKTSDGEKTQKGEQSSDGKKDEKKSEGKDAEEQKEGSESGEKKKNNKKGNRKKNGNRKNNGNRKKNTDPSKRKNKKNKDEAAKDTAAEEQTAEQAADAQTDAPAEPRPSDVRESAVPTVELMAEEVAAPDAEIDLSVLEGAWETKGSRGARAEISGNRLIRLQDGAPVLAANFTVKQDGESLILQLAKNELRLSAKDAPYATVKSCVYEDGALIFTDLSDDGEDSAELHPTKNSRYGAVTDVSYEMLPQLAGRWEQEGGDAVLEFAGSTMTFGSASATEGAVNIIVVRNNRERSAENGGTGGKRANRPAKTAENGETPRENTGKKRTGGASLRILDSDPAKKTVGIFDRLTLQGDTIRATLRASEEGAEAANLTFKRAAAAAPAAGNAPTAVSAITSTEISEFSCSVSLASVYLPNETELTSPHYAFSAKRDGDSVSCRRVSSVGDESFTRDAAFMDRLQEIVTNYGLAAYDGRSQTSAASEDFGAVLRVTYASGEAINAADRQNMFLPLDAVRALVQCFFAAS